MGYPRICAGCEQPFDAANYRQTRCHKDCGRDDAHRARTAVRARHEVEFIAVDGEGITDDNGDHHYVLLSVGDQSYHRNGQPLHHDEIFEFLYDQFEEHPDAAFVGFFLGYDFTQWVRTLTANRGAMLLSPQGITARQPRSANVHQPFMVDVDGHWQIDLLGHKRFKLRPTVPRGQKPAPTMYVCDAGPFFQTSFLNVIDPRGWPAEDYPVSTQDYQIIMEGKKRRADAVFDLDMVRYNVTENRVLSQVMEKLNHGFVDAGVRLNKQQWFGPGQAASAWLKDHCDHLSDLVREATPLDVLEAAIAAYYGGWFEIFCHGHVPDDSYEFDLNSAYPAAIAQLPCLLHGEWIHNPLTDDVPRWTLERVTVSSTQDIVGAAPYRNRDGAISRPRQVTGWFWKFEIDAYVTADLARRVHVHERWSYDPCPCPPPMAAVRDLYQQRIALGEQGKNSPQGKALKLLYNSMYGKFAQSVGKPRYANSVWASAITALTRAAIADLIGSHPTGVRDLLMVATDAVFFRSDHPHVTDDKTTLGAWSRTLRSNLTLFMPGVYWDDATRAALAADEAPKLKSRGISGRLLAACVSLLDERFRDFDPTHVNTLGILAVWPAIEVPLDFAMITATQAVARHKWELAGTLAKPKDGEDHVVRHMSSDPKIKRDPLSAFWDRDVLRTRRWDFADESAPYDRHFGMGQQAVRDDDPWTPDGNISMILHDGFDW